MQQHAVGERYEVAARLLMVSRGLEDAGRFTMGIADLLGVRLLPMTDLRRWGRRRPLQRIDQSLRPAARHCDGLDHGDAELARQPFTVERIPTPPRKVAHVEREDHRQTKTFDLEREAYGEREMRRIGDQHDGLGLRFAGETPQGDIACDRLIERGGREAIGAR